MQRISRMPVEQEQTQGGTSPLASLRHSMLALIFLDLISLGLYSAARSYLVHAALIRKTGRRIFSAAFLHILIVFNLSLIVLRYSRWNMPLDETLIMARVGASLLLISLLLIFRRSLRHEFGVSIGAWPLAVFGFWYLQHAINRSRHSQASRRKEPWYVIPLVMVIFVAISLTLGTLRHYRVNNSSMEPTLLVGDYVLVDPLVWRLQGAPRYGDLLVYRSQQDKNSVQVKRVVGLPGDRLGFHGHVIQLNGKPLACTMTAEVSPTSDSMDLAPKHAFLCDLGGRKFPVHRYRVGALTDIQGDFSVPEGHYFLVGDNLDNSPDSRTTGPIPLSHIIGRVHMTTISYRFGADLLWHRCFQLF
jgi:signal peptidase I